MIKSLGRFLFPTIFILIKCEDYLTIRPFAHMGCGSIAHEAKPNGLFASWAIDPWPLRAKGLIVLVSPN